MWCLFLLFCLGLGLSPELCVWLIVCPEFCRCAITVFPSCASAGVDVSIAVVAVLSTRGSCCRTFLVDLPGVVDTALSTSLFGVIGVKSWFLDHVLFLVS